MNSERKHDWAFLAFCSDIITDMWCRTILLNTVYINSAVWLTNFLFDTSHRQSFIFWSNTLGHPSRNQEVFAKDYLLTYLLTYLACLNWSSANANGVSSLINTDSPVLQHTYSVNAAACLVSDTSKFDRGLTQLMHVDLQCLDVPERVKFKLVSMTHNCLITRLPGTRWTAAIPVSDVASRLCRGGFTHVQHVRPNRGPTKMGPPHEDQKISATCQHTEIACANIIINRLFNNSSTKSSRVALLEPNWYWSQSLYDITLFVK